MHIRRTFLFIYLLSGAAALLYEVLWLRLLTLSMEHTAGAVGTVLAAFMGGLAIGAWRAGPIAESLSPRRALRTYAWLEVSIGTCALLIPVVLSFVRPILGWAHADGEGARIFALTLGALWLAKYAQSTAPQTTEQAPSHPRTLAPSHLRLAAGFRFRRGLMAAPQADLPSSRCALRRASPELAARLTWQAEAGRSALQVRSAWRTRPPPGMRRRRLETWSGRSQLDRLSVRSSPSVSQSPTITTPAMTQAGMILGTAAYMSPEQAHGKPVDKRADIWAFGLAWFRRNFRDCACRKQ